MKLRSTVPGIMVAVTALSCGFYESPVAMDGLGVAVGYDSAATEMVAGYVSTRQAASPQAAVAQRRLIRSAELRMEVERVVLALNRADSIATAQGGLVADMRVSQDRNGKREATAILRVPSGVLTETLTALKQLGDVRNEVVTSEDVTKAYFDLETRLGVKEQTSERLRAILRDRTGRLSDVIEAERELDRVVTEIEQLKGERRFYDQRIALSDVRLALIEPGAIVTSVSGTGIRSAFRRSLATLATSVAWLIYLVTFLAPWVLVASLVWWAARVIRRRFGWGRPGSEAAS